MAKLKKKDIPEKEFYIKVTKVLNGVVVDIDGKRYVIYDDAFGKEFIETELNKNIWKIN